MGPWTSRAPSLVLHCKGSVTSLLGRGGALHDGVQSSPIEAPYQDVAAIHLWDGPATSIPETADRSSCTAKKKKKKKKKGNENIDTFIFKSDIYSLVSYIFGPALGETTKVPYCTN